MQESIELTLDSPDGTIDCRLDLLPDAPVATYSATILYPATAGGYSRSEIYCVDMVRDQADGIYAFVYGDDGIAPKIGKLEQQLASAIANANK